MFVAYSRAHSSAAEGFGASTLGGTTEATIARHIEEPFLAYVRAEGWACESFVGKLEGKIGAINRAFVRAKKDGMRWMGVEVHFNSTPLEICPCGSTRNIGSKCTKCGRTSGVRWRFGHRVMIRRNNVASTGLGIAIMDRLGQLMPKSTARNAILIPDDRYPRSAWPMYVYRPAVLVEAGFGCDPVFSEWISSTAHQVEIGSAIAEAMIEWAKTRIENGIDLRRWAG